MKVGRVFAEIPPDLKIELDVYCARTGKKQKEVIRLALEQFLKAEMQAK